MNCSDCRQQLNDFVDGALAPSDHAAVCAHLASCPGCRKEADGLRALRKATQELPRALPPRHDLWPEIAAQLAPAKRRDRTGRVRTFPWRAAWVLTAAAAVVVLALFLVDHGGHGSAWTLTAVEGAPRLGARPVATAASARPGDWIETDAGSQARLAVGSIGEVQVQPNSRVRIVATDPTHHRLELKRGRVDALIWAPPRLFFIDTPAAQVIDLGCAYTLAVDAAGAGELTVTAGYVALEHAGREAIVPAGLKCLTRPGAGPGTPYRPDASTALRAALARLDFGPAAERGPALAQLLEAATEADHVTLWHLLARTGDGERARVFDVLARLSPPPPGVTRSGILDGSVEMRRSWARALGLGVL